MKSLRKLVDVVDVWNTPAKDPNNKGELPKRTEEKKKKSEKFGPGGSTA